MFFNINNKLFSILVGLISAGVFCTGIYVSAVTYTYNPGDTLNPDCSPTDANCMAPPAVYSFGSNAFSGSGDLTTTGNVGIGTTSPSTLLTIKSDGINTWAMEGIAGSNSSMLWSLGEGNGATSGQLAVYYNNSTRILLHGHAVSYINTGSNFGIGTTAPNNLLQVADLIDFNNTNQNTKLGYQAGKNIASGAQQNTFVGYQAGLSSSTDSTSQAEANSGFGYQALASNSTGYGNTANGNLALYSNTTGYYNTAMGQDALLTNDTGNNNIAIGNGALRMNVLGSNNVALGYYAGSFETGSNAFYIDNQDRGDTAGDKARALLYGIFNATATSQILTINAGTVNLPYITAGTGSAGNVTIDSTTGKLWVTSSSLRFKHDIQPLQENWASILQIEPKSFKYNGGNQSDIGYIAEDFDALGLKDLVLYDGEGRPNAIKYDRITLYNTEILKQQQIDINNLKQKLGITADSNIINPAGTLGSGDVSGVTISGFDQSVKSSLANLGASLSGGIISLKQVITDNLTAKIARFDKIEIVATNGEIYCTWINNAGNLQKTKGACATIDVSAVTAEIPNPETPPLAPDVQSEPANNVVQQLDDLSQQVAQQQQEIRRLSQQDQPAPPAPQQVEEQPQQSPESPQPPAPQQVPEQAQQEPQNLNIAPVDSVSDIDVSANVTVDQPTEEIISPIEDLTSTTAELIQDSASGLLNGVLKYIKLIFISPAEKVFSLPIVQETKNSLINNINVLQAGLLPPIQKVWSKISK